MKKIMIILTWGLALAACKDSFDLDKMQNTSKMVVYCFPSEADTTWISISNSVSVKKYADTHKTGPLSAASVSYAVNGEPRQVQQDGNGHFFVTGGHRPGDHITLRAEHDEYAAVEAITTVPATVPVVLNSVREVSVYDSYWMEQRNLYQLQATFTDPAATADYYAVRVCVKGYHGWGEYLDSLTVWPNVETLDEPLLQGISSIDEDFGFENNFYGNFYIFSDQDINGQTYTMRLDIDRSLSGMANNEDFLFRVVLYSITADYYHFLRSVNDVENNELAQGGFAQLTPTHTNVRHGIGVVGGYWQQKSNWCPLQKE